MGQVALEELGVARGVLGSEVLANLLDGEGLETGLLSFLHASGLRSGGLSRCSCSYFCFRLKGRTGKAMKQQQKIDYRADIMKIETKN